VTGVQTCALPIFDGKFMQLRENIKAVRLCINMNQVEKPQL